MGVFDNLKNIASSVMGNLPGDISLDKLFNADFMKQFTNFSSFKDFAAKGGFKIDSLDDIMAIAGDKLDSFVKNGTKFGNWKEMLEKATQLFLKK
jgi:hypothetical protein